jgi:hypothetical protein
MRSLLVLLAGCMSSSEAPSRQMVAPAAPPPPPGEGGAVGFADDEAAMPMAAPAATMAEAKPLARAVGSVGRRDRDGADQPAEEPASAAPTRAWFPESFLWQPLVETKGGAATVDVPVPDTLTTWRVLALGQTAQGAQGGAVTSFASRMDAYVDLAVPTFLVSGDRVSLPVQAVNLTDSAIRADLRVRTGGAAGGGGISLPARGSVTDTFPLVAGEPGPLTVRAELGDLDAVEKTVRVRPAGRRTEVRRGGSLATARAWTLELPAQARYGSVRVTAFPGALGVIAGEVAALGGTPASLPDAAYAYALALAANALNAEDADPLTVRAARLRAWPVLTRAGRSPDPVGAMLLAAALRDAPAKEMDGRLLERARDVARQAQQPDGLWSVPSGAGLDRSLVTSAFGAIVAADRGQSLRAAGAFERFAGRVTDAHTAAWILLAGGVEEGVAKALQQVVDDATVDDGDGTRHLPAGGTRLDGARASAVDATAVATLASSDPQRRAEMASWLLANWSSGWDGLSDLVVLRAVQVAFGGEAPAAATVHLLVDGAEVANATLDASHPHAPVTLPAALPAGPHQVEVRSEPALPGLAVSLVLEGWLPWAPSAPAGVDLQVRVPALSVGIPGTLALTASGPAEQRLDLEIGLPAGVVATPGVLNADFVKAVDGVLHIRGLKTEGGRAELSIPVVASLAGTLHPDASRVTMAGREDSPYILAPAAWTVR